MLHLADGREVIDGLAGLWNVNVGHGRGELADAAAGQMRKIAYASAYVGATNEPAIRLGEKIVKHAYANSSAVYYTTGGAELNEFAFKTARFFWKVQDKPEKTKFISRLARLSRRHDGGDERDRHGRVPQDVRAAGAGLRPGRAALSVSLAGQRGMRHRRRRGGREGDPARRAGDRRGVICEPVMGAGGVIVPPDSYFPKLREICDRYDVLLIADEVITGFGRTGRWFALGHWGVEPDIVSFAKGVTSGYLPLGGNILSKRVHDAILNAPLDRRYMHAATYSGHPVCCAVGLRNVEILDSEGLVDRAAVMGSRANSRVGNAEREIGMHAVVEEEELPSTTARPQIQVFDLPEGATLVRIDRQAGRDAAPSTPGANFRLPRLLTG